MPSPARVRRRSSASSLPIRQIRVMTPMEPAGVPGRFRDTLTEARKQRLIAETDNGRPGTTADVAALVTFLASPSAGHVTGQVLHVNGGAYLGR